MLRKVGEAGEKVKLAQAQEVVAALPAGHPLKEAIGDVSGLLDLPEGHPLWRDIREAKQRYDEATKDEVLDTRQKFAEKMKKVRRLDADKKRQVRLAEEQDNGEQKASAAKINAALDKTIRSLKDLFEVVDFESAVLSKTYPGRVAVERIKRTAYNVERVLGSIRLRNYG